jgi:hypothetical protein
MKALVSWEDHAGGMHRWALEYDERDPEARHFLDALQLHVRFKLDALGLDEAGTGPAAAE